MSSSLFGEQALTIVRKSFSKINDKRRSPTISLPDSLMSTLAIYSLKIPSLLKFEELKANEKKSVENIKTIYSIKNVPSDTQMRTIIDDVNPEDIRPAFKNIFRELQTKKKLDPFKFLGNYYLLAIDGTGYYYSKKTQCECCMIHNSEKRGLSYRHHLLGASIIHPDCKEVIPICPEPITKKDGLKKNDNELVAVKRFLTKFREDHPKLNVVVVEDALFSNGPHIKELYKYQMSFIIGVKEAGNPSLYSFAETAKRLGQFGEFEQVNYSGTKIVKKVVHKINFVNSISLNFVHEDLKVNFLEYFETTTWTDSKGIFHEKKQKFSWITNINLNNSNVMKVMRGARCRWKIENETFNTLKNQGYNFEHSYGHGTKNLCTNFVYLMMLAFLIDQSQQICCPVFQKVLKFANGKKQLWSNIQSLFNIFRVKSWSQLLYELNKMSDGDYYEFNSS